MRRLVLGFVLVTAGCTSHHVDPVAGFNIADLKGVEFRPRGEARTVRFTRVQEFAASKDGIEINLTRVEELAPVAAAAILKQSRFQVEELYQDDKSPYPGFVSKTVKCAKEFQPVFLESPTGEPLSLRVEAAANSRKILGVCNAAEARYRAIWLYLYCPKLKALLQIESFSLWNKPAPDRWLVGGAC